MCQCYNFLFNKALRNDRPSKVYEYERFLCISEHIAVPLNRDSIFYTHIRRCLLGQVSRLRTHHTTPIPCFLPAFPQSQLRYCIRLISPGCQHDLKTLYTYCNNVSKSNINGSITNMNHYIPVSDLKIIFYDAFFFNLNYELRIMNSCSRLRTHNSRLAYSVRNDFTGLAIAALIAWKLTVIIAITIAMTPASINIHQPILIR